MQPLVTLPLPNTSRPRAPVPPPTLASVPAPGVTARPPDPRPTPLGESAPAVSDPAKKPESNPKKPESTPKSPAALNPPPAPADKAEAGRVVRSLSAPPAAPAPASVRTVATAVPATRVASAPQRGPLPALIRDAVPRVTAILVASDRRFATIDGGQIVGIGDLLGRRTVVGMDERSLVLQEPSGVQIRIGLGGRLLGVERAAR
jgi:hypothetical protein